MTNSKKYSWLYLITIFFVISINAQERENKILTNSHDLYSSENLGITLSSLTSVHLKSNSRFYSRYQGNIDYLRYQYDHYGDFMLQAFASRHYSPGKLLERMWDGEYAGKWLDAAVRVAVNTRDNTLLELVDKFASSLKTYQKPNGYMGIELPTNRKLNDWEKDWDLWNQWNSMIGFLTHYELRGDKTSLKAAAGIGDWILNTYSPLNENNLKFINGKATNGMTNVVVIGQLVRLYHYTGNESLLDFVGQVIKFYPPIQQMLSTGKPYLFHPYMLSAVLMGIADYASTTKNPRMLAKVEEVWLELYSTYLFPTGSLGERENLDDKPIKDVPDGQLQETCATTEWIFLSMKLYEITGHVKYVAALEETIYNALLGAQSDNGMKWCYWTPLRYSKHFLYGPTRCCFWSGPRGIARIPQLIYSTGDYSIFVNLFESSEATLTTKGGEVKVKQVSQFPEKGKSSIIVESPAGWNGQLFVRIPAWAIDFKTLVDGENNSNVSDQEKYYEIDLRNSNKIQIEISFDIPLFLGKLDDSNCVMKRGPEVLSIDARDNIDTWLGAEDDLISIPPKISFQPIDSYEKYKWPGPLEQDPNRRIYMVKLDDERTEELRGFILTPYADAGNEGAAFRTVFPLSEKKN